MKHHIQYTDAERQLAGAARAAAMNGDVLYHGTRYARLILATDVLFRAESGNKKVCLSRSPEAAAYWALLPRDDDEKRGAIFVLDRKTLERQYRIGAVPGPFWYGNEIFHDEAEEQISEEVINLHLHLVGFVMAVGRHRQMPPERPHRKKFYTAYRKRIESRLVALLDAHRKIKRNVSKKSRS